MIIKFRNPGEYGIIKDIDPHDLPLGVWSDGNNVRFRDGRVERISGHTAVYESATPTTEDNTTFILPYFDGTDFKWLLAGDEVVYSQTGQSRTEVTRTAGVGDYSADADNRWNGCIFGGVPIINNGVDPPQSLTSGTSPTIFEDLKWNDSAAGGSTSTWLTTDGTDGATGTNGFTCKVMRSYRDHLIALNITDQDAVSDGNNPYEIRWSHAASAGAVPVTWDASNDAYDAGTYSLVETPDYLVDCLTLRDQNIVYKESTTWLMRYVGAPRIFEFSKILGESGMMAQQCAVEFQGQHLVKTLDDLILHNGQQVTGRVLDKSWRRWLQNNIDATNYDKCFMVPNHRQLEIWFCFPSNGKTYPDRALIWNYQDNKISVRDLPDMVHAAVGIIADQIDDTLGNSVGTIAAQEGIYDQRLYDPIAQYLLMSKFVNGATNATLYQSDTGNTFGGASITSTLTREGIPLTENDTDARSYKMVRGIIPYITGTVGGTVEVRIGTQVNRTDEIDWEDWQTYTIGTTRTLNFRASGYYMSIQYRTTDQTEWSLGGFDIDVIETGRQ